MGTFLVLFLFLFCFVFGVKNEQRKGKRGRKE